MILVSSFVYLLIGYVFLHGMMGRGLYEYKDPGWYEIMNYVGIIIFWPFLFCLAILGSIAAFLNDFS